MSPIRTFPKKLIDRLVDVPSSTLLGWWVGIVLICAVAYQALSLWAPLHAPAMSDGTSLDHFLNSLYFSVVTVTTVGYGDFVPHGVSRAIAASEGVAGFALFGLLVGKIASRKQERVINEVHRHVVADTVAGLREGLFVVRKDLDMLIASLKKKTVTDDQWETLDVALMHAEILVREIPSLVQNRFGGVDARRDALLTESVQRTIRRLQAFVTAAAHVSADCYRHELSGFLNAVLDVSNVRKDETPTWTSITVETEALRKAVANLKGAVPSASRRSTARLARSR